MNNRIYLWGMILDKGKGLIISLTLSAVQPTVLDRLGLGRIYAQLQNSGYWS